MWFQAYLYSTWLAASILISVPTCQRMGRPAHPARVTVDTAPLPQEIIFLLLSRTRYQHLNALIIIPAAAARGALSPPVRERDARLGAADTAPLPQEIIFLLLSHTRYQHLNALITFPTAAARGALSPPVRKRDARLGAADTATLPQEIIFLLLSRTRYQHLNTLITVSAVAPRAGVVCAPRASLGDDGVICWPLFRACPRADS